MNQQRVIVEYTKYSNIILIHFLYHISLYALPILILYIRNEVEITYTQAGLLWTATTIISTLLSLAVGPIADQGKTSRYALIYGSITTMTAALYWISRAQSFYDLIYAFIMMGAGAAGFHPPAMAIITEMFENSKGKALSLNINVGMIGTAISPLIIAGLITEVRDWRNATSILSLIVAISVMLAFLLDISTSRTGIQERSTKQELTPRNKENNSFNRTKNGAFNDYAFIFTPLILIPLALISLRSSFFRTASFFTALLYKDYLHLTEENASIATAIVIGFGSLFTMIGGTLSDKYRPRAVILASTSGMFLATLGLVFIIANATLLLFSILYFMMIASYYLATPATSALLADRVLPEQRGKVFGALFSIGQTLSMLTPTIFGLIKDQYNITVAFSFMLTLAFLALFLARYIYITDKKRETAK